MQGATITVDNVLVIRMSDLGWICEVDGERLFVGRLQVVLGAEMPPVGARGSIVLTVSGASDLGLAHSHRATG